MLHSNVFIISLISHHEYFLLGEASKGEAKLLDLQAKNELEIYGAYIILNQGQLNIAESKTEIR